MLPTLPYIPKISHPLQGCCLQWCFSMAGLAWRLVDSHGHPPPFHNPSSSSWKFSCKYNTHIVWTPFYPLGCFGDIPPLSLAILLEYISSQKLFCQSSHFSRWCQVRLRRVQRMPWIPIFALFASNNWKQIVKLSKNITLINNAMKINLWKTSTKTCLSSSGYCTF